MKRLAIGPVQRDVRLALAHLNGAAQTETACSEQTVSGGRMSVPTEQQHSTPPNGVAMEQPRRFYSYDTIVSSEEAVRILETVNWERQRDVSDAHVRDLRMAILKGELTFLTLAYAQLPDGRLVLVDGQHRLWALSDLNRSLDATVVVHRVHTDREVGELYLKYDRSKARGPDVALKALGVLENSPVRSHFVKRMSPAVALIRSGFSRSYRQDKSFIDRADDVRTWLPEITLYHDALAGISQPTHRRLVRAAVAAVALVTFKHQPGMASEFWSRTASQEMLKADDPRYRLMAWLNENTTTRNKRGLSEVAYALHVAGAWNAYAEGRALKLLKVADTSAAIRIAGTPYQGERTP